MVVALTANDTINDDVYLWFAGWPDEATLESFEATGSREATDTHVSTRCILGQTVSKFEKPWKILKRVSRTFQRFEKKRKFSETCVASETRRFRETKLFPHRLVIGILDLLLATCFFEIEM